MTTYQHILVAIDLTTTAEEIVKKALQFKTSKLTIMHVIDYLPYMGFAQNALITPTYSVPVDELIERARPPINALLESLDITDRESIIQIGRAATEVVRFAEERDVDLIVVGSHGRHGVQLLLGSTANEILHHANCDVLAVRVNE